MRLKKEQKNAIIDMAIANQQQYFGMCTCLIYAIIKYCNIDSINPASRDIARDIISKKFPRFNRENFIRFVERNYPKDIADVMYFKRTDNLFWIAIHPDKDHIRIDYLNNLKQ